MSDHLNKYWILFLAIIFSACSKSVDTSINNSDPDKIFSALLQETIDHSYGSVSGVSMSINSPLLKEPWSGAAGFADKELNIPLEASQAFRIASVTKTFVAVAILRLHEMDSLSIDDPIANYLKEPILSILKSDGYEPEKILIKHCLNHTSGLFDYAMGSEHFINEIIKNPKKRWTRKDQLEVAMRWGDKLGEPGQQTVYSDTGYILLGALIEKYFNGDLAKGLRTLLKFDELGLKTTWLETLENHELEGQTMVHRYLKKIETTDWDASIDLYGGGGLASTTQDLADFFHALFNHKIHEKENTVKLMLSIPEYISSNEINDEKEIEFYNYGMWTVKIFGEEAHLHNGIWGSTMLYIPEYQASIAINTTRGKADRMIKKVILVLKELKANQ